AKSSPSTSAATPGSSAASPSVRPLAGCRSLADLFPEDVYRTVGLYPDSAQQRDTVDRSQRSCSFGGVTPDGRKDQRTRVDIVRKAVPGNGADPDDGLREDARQFVGYYCGSEKPYTPTGFQWATACYHAASDGGFMSVGVISDDTMVGVEMTGRRGATGPAQFHHLLEDNALATATAIRAGL
ncbi:MAG: hypothetical protein WCA46_26520, partial [Actinocatenispora sp.]